MRRRSPFLPAFAASTCAAALASACAAPAGRSAAPPPAAPAATTPPEPTGVAPGPTSLAPHAQPGIDSAALDPAVDPCSDFYAYACGGWIKKTPIPPDRPAWFRSFSEIDERNMAVLRGLLESYAAAPRLDDPNARKLGDHYAVCMDEAKAETASLETLRAELAAIDALPGLEALPARLAALHLAGASPFFGFGSQQDFRDAERVIGVADQAGLGLPDRDYYLKKDRKSAELRRAYERHVATMLALTGVPEADAARNAASVLKLETALAAASMSRVDRRSPEKIYHRLERAGLVKLAPRFGWDAYFAALGAPEVNEINVTVPRFFERLGALLPRLPLPELRAYLKWHLVDSAAAALGKTFVEADFQFSAKHLTGAEQILPRWKRCVGAVEGAMGQALGRPFVARTFGDEGKARALALVKGIEHAFGDALGALDWMDEPTRAQAEAKLERVYNKIGFPSKWRDYTDLQVDRTSYLANRMRAAAFEARRDLAKIGKPVDRTEWHMPPQAVNAYYDPSMNEMVFPAGILQPPFFDRAAGAPENFGGIGMVMGHELTHGFDDEGRKFDAAGNLRDWWSPAVGKGFEARAACVADQYGKYAIAPDARVNGRLTLGENIADIGGLKMAYRAFTRTAAGPKEAPTRAPDGGAKTDGPRSFSPEQRFFVSFAQSWCSNRREPYARLLINVDPHSPPEFRVNGAVSNLPEFQQAFSCQAGAPMAPVRRCTIW